MEARTARQSGVVDLKRSDLLWWKVQLPLKFFIFCHLDPVCYIFAAAFMKLANLLYHCCTRVCLVSSTIPETRWTDAIYFIDMICKGNWSAFSYFELSSRLCYVHLFQTPHSSSSPLLVDINNHFESLINAQGCGVSTMTLSWLLITISQYLSLITSFATLVKHFYCLSTICFDILQTETVGFNVFLWETI